MGTITISHTALDGTLLTGSRKGDGVLEIVRAHGFTWRREPGIFIRGSRDKPAQTRKINAAADELRAAGHTVTVEIDNELRPIARVEADRADRAVERADRLDNGADRASGRAYAAYRQAHDLVAGIPFGQPVLTGHHSERRHRRVLDKSWAAMGKSAAEERKAEYLGASAEGVRRNQTRRTSSRTTLRRIQRHEAEKRGVEREIAEAERVNASADYMKRLTDRLARLVEEITYWQEQIGGSGFRPWGPEHFRKGDFACIHNRWFEVIRVNKKTLTVPPIIDMRPVVTAADRELSWTDTVPYDEVYGRRRDGSEITAAPTDSE